MAIHRLVDMLESSDLITEPSTQEVEGIPSKSVQVNDKDFVRSPGILSRDILHILDKEKRKRHERETSSSKIYFISYSREKNESEKKASMYIHYNAN